MLNQNKACYRRSFLLFYYVYILKINRLVFLSPRPISVMFRCYFKAFAFNHLFQKCFVESNIGLFNFSGVQVIVIKLMIKFYAIIFFH